MKMQKIFDRYYSYIVTSNAAQAQTESDTIG
jgi:hypothetical protein